MPQETNLNVSPYFDDFDANKNFYKVLFKPGQPVQARELTTLQSILQNQIETFGNHIFKEGSLVIPGGLNYIPNLIGVQIQPTFNGVSVDSYIDNLLNKDIVGEDSGARARVVKILKAGEEDNPFTLLYCTFKSDANSFFSQENLLAESAVSPGFSTLTQINSNQSFCTTIVENPNVLGSALIVNEGVYFIRGYFITVPTQNIILDWNSNFPSYSVGFEIFEEIVTADDDSSLYDNARGFSNFAAPGSDRFKITAVLDKRRITTNETTSVTDKNYVEIFRVLEGELKKLNRNAQYDEIAKEFARRTYDESGDYYVRPFTIEVKESLNDFLGNDGAYFPEEVTSQGLTPSKDLGVYKISAGKAYVQGYEVENLGTQLLDFVKPRTTKELRNQYINFANGSSFTLNRVYGAPSLEIDGSYIVSLRDSRVGVSQTTAPGKEIGLARVYDFALESGLYNESVKNLNEWDISLYDIQMYNEFTVNEPITLTIPTHIKGKASGATAFLRYATSNSGIITAYNIEGNFQVGEKLIFDDKETNVRVSIAVTEYGVSDISSLYGIVGTAYTFTADIKPIVVADFGPVSISTASGGISTVRTSNPDLFFNISLKKNDIVTYNVPGISTFTFSQVVSVSDKTFTIAGITTVAGICEGALPSSAINLNNIFLLKSPLKESSSNSLFTPLPKENVSTVDLTNSILIIRKEFDVQISANAVTISPTVLESNESFVPFDEENYVLVRKDGQLESLSADKFSFTDNNRGLSIFGLGTNSDARLIATIQRVKVKAKQKNKIKISTITLDKSTNPGSGIGASTLNDGLVYGNYPYGTRVQDSEICLNYPDVTKIYGVFESSNTSDPVLPSLSLININGANGTVDDFIIGEEIYGSNSLAVGRYVGKVNSTTINYVLVSDNTFLEDEQITFAESGASGTINTIQLSSTDISDNYTFSQGAKNYIYDYSTLILNKDKIPPSKKITLVFERGGYSDSDTGDLTTIDSYAQFDWCEVPFTNDINNGDTIDLRPRVSNYTVLENSRSPLEFLGRSFGNTGNSARNIIASDTSIVSNYSYYLGRVDKIYLSRDNTLQVRQGEPSDNPLPPEPIENALEIATVIIPPYQCNAESALVILTEHKRYQMKDIARLEDRIKNLEYYTTLSLLEKDTSSLTIKDANGIDRFKSGLFVDNFKTTTFQIKETEVKNSIDMKRGELRPTPYTTEIDLLLGDNTLLNNEDTFFTSYDAKYATNLIGIGVTRSGINPTSAGKGVITLNYREVVEISQPFATRIENVTPYFVTVYEGIMDLNPSSDIWVDRTQLSPLTVQGFTGEMTTTTLQLTKEQIDTQGGWSPIVWDSWSDQWTGSF